MITAVPPAISPCTMGAETSSPPTKIAIGFPMFSFVSSWKSFPPSSSNTICTTGTPTVGSVVTDALRKCLPSSGVSFHPVGRNEKKRVRRGSSSSFRVTARFWSLVKVSPWTVSTFSPACPEPVEWVKMSSSKSMEPGFVITSLSFLMMWYPNSVSIGPVISPTGSFHAASSKTGLMVPRGKAPNFPAALLEGPSLCVRASVSKLSPSWIRLMSSRASCSARSFVLVTSASARTAPAYEIKIWLASISSIGAV